jgi:hypothetical protein
VHPPQVTILTSPQRSDLQHSLIVCEQLSLQRTSADIACAVASPHLLLLLCYLILLHSAGSAQQTPLRRHYRFRRTGSNRSVLVAAALSHLSLRLASRRRAARGCETRQTHSHLVQVYIRCCSSSTSISPHLGCVRLGVASIYPGLDSTHA